MKAVAGAGKKIGAGSQPAGGPVSTAPRNALERNHNGHSHRSAGDNPSRRLLVVPPGPVVVSNGNTHVAHPAVQGGHVGMVPCGGSWVTNIQWLTDGERRGGYFTLFFGANHFSKPVSHYPPRTRREDQFVFLLHCHHKIPQTTNFFPRRLRNLSLSLTLSLNPQFCRFWAREPPPPQNKAQNKKINPPGRKK